MGASKRQIGGVSQRVRTPEQERAKYAKRKRTRTVMVKFRVVPTVRMPRSKLFREMVDSIESGTMSRFLRMEYVDYEGKTGASLKPGRKISTKQVADLEQLIGLMFAAESQGGIRFERTR